MPVTSQLASAAELFRVLGSPARLAILQELGKGPLSVSALSERTGMSQPLISQHLRVLRIAGAVGVERSGRERINQLADEHVHHIVQDTLAHVGHSPTTDATNHPEENVMTADQTTHEAAEHTFEEHTHGEHCGHEAIQHGDHVDFLHDGHRHAAHEDHYDEHDAPAEHTVEDHEHGENCGHEAVEHGDHVDYQHDGHKHALHGDHYDEH